MTTENLEMIINSLRLRMNCYCKNSEAYKELKNAVDMLTAKCYRDLEV